MLVYCANTWRAWRSALLAWARRIKRDVLAIYFAARNPLTPWHVRVLALAVAAYALSPIDLIPDFIPVLGFLDDALLLPLGILLVVRLLPEQILVDARARADVLVARPVSRAAARVVVGFWVLGLIGVACALGWVPGPFSAFECVAGCFCCASHNKN